MMSGQQFGSYNQNNSKMSHGGATAYGSSSMGGNFYSNLVNQAIGGSRHATKKSTYETYQGSSRA